MKYMYCTFTANVFYLLYITIFCLKKFKPIFVIFHKKL